MHVLLKVFIQVLNAASNVFVAALRLEICPIATASPNEY